MPRTRRALLASLGAAAAAGCLGGPPASESPTSTETATETPTATPTPAPPDSVETDWAAPAHDDGLSNGTTAAGPADRPGLLWETDAGSTPSTPVVAGGTVYAGGTDGRVRALDARTGDPEWTAAVGGAAGPPWVRDGTVFVPTDGALVALAADGTERWRVETPDRVATLVAGHGTYWLQDGTPTVVAHGFDGGERWRTDLGEVWEPPLFAGEDEVFVSSGSRDSRFWRLDAASGTVTGDRPRAGADFPAEQYHRDGTVYAVDAFFGNVDTVAVGEDGVDWSQGVPPGGRAGRMSGGAELTYYTAGTDGEPDVTALSASGGDVAWQVHLDAPVADRVVAAGAVALVPTGDGLRALDPADGSLRWSLPVATGRVAVADDLLYAAVEGSVRAYRAP